MSTQFSEPEENDQDEPTEVRPPTEYQPDPYYPEFDPIDLRPLYVERFY
jgi:hypothetical protein